MENPLLRPREGAYREPPTPLLERVGHSPDAPKKGGKKEKEKKRTKTKSRCTSVPLRCGRVGNLEPLWREVLEGGSRASAPKVSRAREGS